MRSDREGRKKDPGPVPGHTVARSSTSWETLTRGAMRWYWTSLVDGLTLLHLLADGDGSSGRGQLAASPPFSAPPQIWRTAAGFGADSYTPSWMAATPPRLRSTTASLPSHLFFYCSSTTASGSHWQSPLLPAAWSPQQRDPPQPRGLSDSVSPLPPVFRHQCKTVRRYRKKHLKTLTIKINKQTQKKSGNPSRTTAAHKTQIKLQAWSSLVFHCRRSSFCPSESSSVGLETGEWRRCRSLSFTPPASLRSHGPAPLVTKTFQPVYIYHVYIIYLV